MNKDTYHPALRLCILDKFYDSFSLAAYHKTSFGRVIDEVIRSLDIHPGMKLLELGCGPGRLAIRNKSSHPDCDITAVDGDPKILEIARKNARKAGVDIWFATQDITQLKLSAQYDRIYSTFVFHHLTVDGKKQALQKLADLLKPGASLVIADFCAAERFSDRLKFLGVQMIDGFKTTTPHREGWLEENLLQFFRYAEKKYHFSTFLGPVGIFECR